jgi:hypothetical protein
MDEDQGPPFTTDFVIHLQPIHTCILAFDGHNCFFLRNCCGRELCCEQSGHAASKNITPQHDGLLVLQEAWLPDP